MTTWTTPRTWVTGEVLSSANLNTHVRDDLAFYGGADAIASSPPASPGNGQRWVYPADAANGIYWSFMYVTALAAWVFQGGAPMTSRVTAASATTTSTSYVDVSNTASVTVPRAGVYVCRASVVGTQAVASTAWIALAPGVAATDANAVWTIAINSNNTTGYATIVSGSIAASSVVKFQHKNTGGGSGGTSQASYQNLEVTPLKVT